jgi:hypothetical protein
VVLLPFPVNTLAIQPRTPEPWGKASVGLSGKAEGLRYSTVIDSIGQYSVLTVDEKIEAGEEEMDGLLWDTAIHAYDAWTGKVLDWGAYFQR